MEYITQHIEETKKILEQIDKKKIEKILKILIKLRKKKGRLFFIGVGGSAGNCSHAVNDFRKLAGIESYAITDNVSELTARTNDEGWHTIFSEWLKISKLSSKDALFIFSVGGGSLTENISPNIVSAIQLGKKRKCKIVGIVGKKNGFTAQKADACVLVPVVNPKNVTPHSESFQTVIWHLLISHPKLKNNQTKWESLNKKK